MPSHNEAYGGIVNVDFGWNTKGRTGWSDAYLNPNLGVSYNGSFYSVASAGQSHAILGYIQGMLPITEVIDLYGHIGIGLGYVSTIYNERTNFSSQTVASHLNGAADLRFGITAKLSEHWKATGAIMLWHLSNTGFVEPNYGLNLPSVSLGVRYTWTRKNQRQPVPPTEFTPGKELLVSAQFGVRQMEEGDPYHLVGNLTVDYIWKVLPFLSVGLGTGCFYDDVHYEYEKFMSDNPTQIEPLTLKEELAWGLHGTFELPFNRVSIVGSLGYYLIHPHRTISKSSLLTDDYAFYMYYQNRNYMYDYLGLRYRSKSKLVYTLSLRTQLFQALFLQAGVGCSL